MKGKITLCDKEFKENIPQFNYQNKNEYESLIYDFLKERQQLNGLYYKNVYAIFPCFERQPDLDNVEQSFSYNAEHDQILVTNNKMAITLFAKDLHETFNTLDLRELDVAIFEFESWEEAFRYCIDLKEGL